MNWYLYMVLIWVLACIGSGTTAVFTAKGKWARRFVVLTTAFAVFMTFRAPYELIGKAKPASWAWLERGVEVAQVCGEDLVEGEGIYLMLKYDSEAMLYKFPWDQEFAENIQQARQQAQKQGRPVMIDNPFQDANPLAPIQDILNELLGSGESDQGGKAGKVGAEGSGKGKAGDGDGKSAGREGNNAEGNQKGGGNHSLEDRSPPRVYPAPVPPRRPKDSSGPGLIFDRPDDDA